jgi:hypothetical protein
MQCMQRNVWLFLAVRRSLDLKIDLPGDRLGL